MFGDVAPVFSLRFARSSSPGKGGKVRRRSTSRSVTASAVANLRACNEELRNTLSEVKVEYNDLSSSVEKAEKAKVS